MSSCTICVDAMGGDEKPEVVLEGIALALEKDPELNVLVAGAEDKVVPFCEKWEGRARPLVTTEVIEMGDHPAKAIRAKKDSSIVRGCRAVRDGEADGFFSAGSTGAVLAAATLGIGRLRGIIRPALALLMPGPGDKGTVFLDVGANADCRSEMLVQFAHMGRAYSTLLSGAQNPRVGLLSNGSEDTKGSESVLANHAALREADVNFCGNAEGTDILKGTFDVIVTDGFTGNVALKTLEGTAKYIVGKLKEEVAVSKRVAIGALLVKPALKKVAATLSGEEVGGAVLLGLKAPVFIGHGATSPADVCAGTLSCAGAVRADLVAKIAEGCAITA